MIKIDEGSIVISEKELRELCERFYIEGMFKGKNINELPTPRVYFEEIYKLKVGDK